MNRKHKWYFGKEKRSFWITLPSLHKTDVHAKLMPALIRSVPGIFRTPERKPTKREHQSNREYAVTDLCLFRISSSHVVTLSRLCLLLLVLGSESGSLLLDTLLSALAGGLGLGTLGVHLLLELGLTSLLGLGLVDL